jgi:hypothetical protein
MGQFLDQIDTLPINWDQWLSHVVAAKAGLECNIVGLNQVQTGATTNCLLVETYDRVVCHTPRRWDSSLDTTIYVRLLL